ncbi:MAG: O-antigen ligase family protein [Rhabdochlamydiaceae bacterium]
MPRLFLILIFFIPFQARIYKFLKPLSLSWIDPGWKLPLYFEPLADLFVSDFLLIILCLWALFLKRFELRNEKFLTIFLGVAFLSIVISGYGSYLLPYWRWAHLAVASLMLYALRSWAVSLKTIASAVVLSATLECAIAIPQYLIQHQIGFKMVGEPTLVSKHMVASHFDMPKNGITSIDYLFKKSQEPTCVFRACGTLPHPNILGGFLVFSLLMTCLLYEQSSRKKWIGAAIVLQIITLFISYSRAALFAFIAAILLWLFLHYLQEKLFSKIWKPLTLGFTLSLLLFFPQLFYRGGVISYNEVSLRSDVMRISMQDVALQIIRDHPWFGVGYNNYLIAFAKYTHGLDVESISVHNIFLLIATETGLIGLTFFLIFCGLIVYRGWQQRASPEGRTLLTLFLAFLAIGVVDYYPIVFQQTRLIFFLTAGLLSFHKLVYSRVTQSSKEGSS